MQRQIIAVSVLQQIIKQDCISFARMHFDAFAVSRFRKPRLSATMLVGLIAQIKQDGDIPGRRVPAVVTEVMMRFIFLPLRIVHCLQMLRIPLQHFLLNLQDVGRAPEDRVNDRMLSVWNPRRLRRPRLIRMVRVCCLSSSTAMQFGRRQLFHQLSLRVADYILDHKHFRLHRNHLDIHTQLVGVLALLLLLYFIQRCVGNAMPETVRCHDLINGANRIGLASVVHEQDWRWPVI
mmetsp:Transcript_53124/g.84766  ORF Transcript_53124/g.84766 Transcript_53124/m.84766 type:complete len:235 (+) Transcript_53124:1555-2259(+)